jgi:hypothetical protein
MRRVSWVVLAAVPLITAGCNKPAADAGRAPAEGRALDAAVNASGAADGSRGDRAPKAAQTRPRPAPLALPRLAYSYAYSLELPGREIRGLMDRHEQACVEAGPDVCQVMGAEARDDDGEVVGTLKMRARPAWLNRFRAGLGRDAEAVGGRLETSETGTDDLTRDLVDTEAGIRAKTVLRDRLQGLLARRGGKLDDLLRVEHELAGVQQDIDTARSELAVMRARVQTASLTIGYRSFDRLVSGRTAEPLRQATHSVGGIVATGFAFILIVGACALPFAIVGLPGFLLWRAGRRRMVKV